jgi:sulfur-carrier protein
MLHLHVRYFSRVRDILNRSAETVFVDPTSNVGDVVTAIICKHPELAPMRSSLLIARNSEYAAADEQVVEGDTIDLMPPVSGG